MKYTKETAMAVAASDVTVSEYFHEAPFYIAATDSPTRPRRTLKHNDTFVVVDSHGDIGASAGGPDGLFHSDTRFVSLLALSLNGIQPLLLGSNVRDDNSSLTVDLTNPDMYFDNRLVLPKDNLHIVRTIFLWRDTAYQRLAIHNHGDGPIDLRLTLLFDCDFADLFEVRGLRRPARGKLLRELLKPNVVALTYQGLDNRVRQSRFEFDPMPDDLSTTTAGYHVTLAPKKSALISLSIGCGIPEPPTPVPFIRGLLMMHREQRKAASGAATVETSNDVFNQVVCRSMADLYMLTTDTPQGPYPYAGIPWYSTTFGRDGIITALQMLWFDPSIARGVLRRLASLQATQNDPASDAEPGKILHEMRGGEAAALREVPFSLYYGSVDSTPLFVLLAGRYAERTGDYETIRELWPNIEAAFAWIDGPGDPDGDGFVEYHRMTDQGLANQGWKDSFDAIFHADGKLAEGPIALPEVQGYVYAAKVLAARCAVRLGLTDRALELGEQAKLLAQRFEDRFWCEDIGLYALALDGAKRPCRVRSSNAGQVLFTGIARADHAVRVGEQMMSPSFFSGWGIRTIAKTEARYNPMSYHNGSIWPHDNALIGLGLARYGLKRALDRVFKGQFEAASYMELQRLPELFCGFQRARGRGPTLYPVACIPQAWASGTPFTLLEAALGLQFDPDAKEIRLRNPSLPEFLDEVTVRNLRLGDSSIDLTVHRHGHEVSLDIKRRRGEIQVSVVLNEMAGRTEVS